MPDTADPDGDVIHRLFPRIHAVALGASVALTAGVAMFLLTVFHVIVEPDIPIGLLSWYFVGYAPTWPGAFVGLAWASAIGFAVGWLMALVHNVTTAVWMLVVRARADLSRTRSFLDQVR